MLISLGLWSDNIAQPDSQILERIQRLNSEIEKQIIDLHIPEENQDEKIREIKQQIFEERSTKPKQSIRIHPEKKTKGMYLGSGVSDWLNYTETEVELLENTNLPVVKSIKELSELLETKQQRLLWFAYHEEVIQQPHYTEFQITKGKGNRRISKPCKALSAIQYRIKNEILDKISFPSYIHGFVKGHTILDNAREHKNSTSIITMDITNFFDNITFKMVRSAFHRLGYSKQIGTVLALLTTKSNYSKVEIANKKFWFASQERSLPQGACTSPAISNLVAMRFDSQLHARSSNLDFTYTRYADDLTFSTNTDQPNHKAILYLARKTLELHGFKANPRKTKILFEHHQQQVTGLNLNSGKPTVPRRFRRNLRAAVHQFRFIKDPEEKNEEYLRIKGSLQFMRLSHPKKAKQYEIEIDRYHNINPAE